MHEVLYYRDPYAREVRTRIVSVSADIVEVEENPLYPGGGGQPPDIGIMEGEGFRAEVIGHSPGAVRIASASGRPSTGDEVRISLDWERRYYLMKMHTGEHVLFRALSRAVNVELAKVSFERPTGSVFVKGDVSPEDVLGAEEEANRIVGEGRKVTARWVRREEIDEDVRALLHRIKDERVRIVEVEGYDASACSGIHVANTSEIGCIFVEGLRKRGKTCEIRFRVAGEAEHEAWRHSTHARLAAWRANCDVEDLPTFVANAMGEVERLRKAVLTLASTADPFVEVCPGVRIAEVPGLDRKAAGELLKGGNGVRVLVSEGERTVVYVASTTVPAREVVEHLTANLGGRGGGGDTFASCYVERADGLRKLICEYLNPPG